MLYSAKVDDIAKPVVSSSSSDTPAAPKVKRVQSDKQIAALAKAQETRKANRAAAKAAGVVPEKKVRPPIGKKQEPTPTDPEATPSESASHVATLVEEPAPAEKKVEEFVTPTPPAKEDKKGKRKAVVLEEGDINPPAWFKTFIRNTRKEEAKASKGAKVPAKQVQAEADKFTMEQWQDHYTRDRVNQQSENHLKKMHQMYNQVRNYSQTILI